VASYLSGEWFEQLGAAMAPAEQAPQEGELVLQHVVTAAPGGEVRYHVRVAHRVVSIGRGQAPDPDVTFTEDYATAAAIARGELRASAALMAGRIRVGGDMTALTSHDLQAVNDPVPAVVRAATTY
jgi:hypothetical protein